MNQTRASFRAYTILVLCGGLGMLAYASRNLNVLEGGAESQANLILWMAMIAVASMTPIPLPRSRGTMSVTITLDFAALLVFGPGLAGWFAILSGVMTNVHERWNPLFRSFQRLGEGVLAVGAAGLVYAYLGGSPGLALGLESSQLTAIAGAGGTYVITRAILGGIGILLEAKPGTSTALWEQVKLRTPFAVVLLPFAAILALAHQRIGPVGVALFLIPLLLTRYVFKLWIESRKAHLETVRTLMAAVDAGDPFSRGHSYRISKMSLAVGRHLGLPDKELEEVEYAALLHDVGRMAIHHDVLVKTGRLTEKEQSLFRVHPKVGHDVVRRFRHFESAADIVYAHHEQPDGQGYPRGLGGEEVPLGSRVIMAVAAFDAMTSDRPYRRGLLPEAAFEELLAHSGSQFYPDVVEALITLYSNGKLFAEFDEEELQRYSRDQSSSRAMDEFMRVNGLRVPEKRGVDDDADSLDNDDDIPVIEMPPLAEEPVRMKKEFAISSDGRWRAVAAAQSDVGCVRKNNEDSFGMTSLGPESAGCLLSIADGMGGAAAGEVASGLAIETLVDLMSVGLGAGSPKESLIAAIEAANDAIHTRATGNHQLGGMGTTCTSLVMVGQEVYVGHVGDSRAYLVENGEIITLTQDHTLAAELEHMVGPGAVAPEGANNVLTRCLGTRAEVDVEVSLEPLQLAAGMVFVLCSDGLSNVVESKEIQEIVSSCDPEAACNRLVKLARERGGPDNITVVVARIQG